MKKPNKPISMIYAEAKSDFVIGTRRIAKAYQLPLFLMAEIAADVAADYKREAMNEQAADAERFTQELENYYGYELSQARKENNTEEPDHAEGDQEN